MEPDRSSRPVLDYMRGKNFHGEACLLTPTYPLPPMRKVSFMDLFDVLGDFEEIFSPVGFPSIN